MMPTTLRSVPRFQTVLHFQQSLHFIKSIACQFLIAIVLLINQPAEATTTSGYIGSTHCAECHKEEWRLWQGSYHDRAMAEASPATVLGDFSGTEFTAHGVTSRFYQRDGGYFVRTDGPDGALHDYKISYTFGWYPLQQYLIEFPRGHLQSFGIAWDSRPKQDGGQHWFHLYPDQDIDQNHPMHWTSREQTWNYQCAECHSTNLMKHYDPASDSYQTSWGEINVSCEACHGPGADHLAWAQAAEKDQKLKSNADKGLAVDFAARGGDPFGTLKNGQPNETTRLSQNRTEIEICARCHSRRGQISEQYEYGKPLSNTHRLALLDEDLYFPDGQIKDEDYVYGSFIQSRMYKAGVTCSNCHDPHSLKRHAEGNTLCGACHQPSIYDKTAHHHHKANSAGAVCINCHMTQRLYMVNDERADHSMRIPRPDLSLKLGTPNACNTCHSDKSIQWAADTVTGWYPDSTHRNAHFGEALHAADVRAPDAEQRLLTLLADNSQPGIARASAAERLRNYAQPEHLPAIQSALTDKDPLVRAAAVRMLEPYALNIRVDALWPLLEDPAKTVRIEAARLLAPLTTGHLPEQYRKQLEPVIEEYVQSLNVTAERPESHLNLGLLYTSQGKLAEAEKAYQHAIALDPLFVPGYVNLADLYRSQGRDTDGENILRKAIEKVPDSADAHYALGLLMVRQKHLDDALVSLGSAAKLAPENTHYAYVYAVALDSTGKTTEALSVLRQALPHAAQDRSLLFALAEFSLKTGDRSNARKYADQLSRIATDDPGIKQLQQSIEQNPGQQKNTD